MQRKNKKTGITIFNWLQLGTRGLSYTRKDAKDAGQILRLVILTIPSYGNIVGMEENMWAQICTDIQNLHGRKSTTDFSWLLIKTRREY